MIADLIEANLIADASRARLLEGPPRRITITADDLDVHVGLIIGNGQAVVSGRRHSDSDLWVVGDSETLLDLPRAKLLGGLPSIADSVGRAVTRKLLTGKLKIKGMYRLGLLTRLQRLLSVAEGG